jgi:hypothetical protein
LLFLFKKKIISINGFIGEKFRYWWNRDQWISSGVIFFSGVKIAGIVIIPLVSGHQIGPLTCGSYRDGSQTLPLYFIVRWGVNYTSIARVFLQYFSYSWFYNSSSKLFWSLLVFVLRYILLKKIFLYNLMCWY